MYFRHGLFIFLTLTCISNLNGQAGVDFISAETKLLKEYQRIFEADEHSREILAIQFFNSFDSILKFSGSFAYPFVKLTKIGKINSADEQLRVISWNIPLEYDQNRYFNIIQYKCKTDGSYKVVSLINKNESLPGSLYGALYFQIIETRHAGQKYYTLLGFDFNTILSNRKVINLFAIDDFDKIYYPEKLFQLEENVKDNIVFEYNEKAEMMLKYDESKKMIVFDHLSPDRPSMENNFQFYGPDFTYDGFKFEKGVWLYYKNIDITD